MGPLSAILLLLFLSLQRCFFSPPIKFSTFEPRTKLNLTIVNGLIMFFSQGNKGCRRKTDLSDLFELTLAFAQ